MRLANHQWPAIICGFSMSFCSGIVSATDLLTVYQLAQENDKTFSAAKNDFDAVKQTLKQAKGLYYPTLGVSYEHIETEQQINRSDNDVFGAGLSDFPTDVLTLSLKQPVFRWDLISERRVAKAEIKQAEYQFIAAEQELILRAAENYLLTLAASDNDFVTRAEMEATGEQLKLAEKRLDVGLANPTEVHESRARFELNQSEVFVSENAVIDREEGLRTIIGKEPGALKPLLQDFAMVTPDPEDASMWIAQAMENNLTIKAREAAVRIASAEYSRQKADRYPTLDLEYNFNNRDTGGSLFGGGSDIDSTDITLRADWTIFQGGSLKARIRESLYKKQRAEDDLELERSTVRRETRKAYLGVVSSIAKAQALQSSLDAQEMTVQAKQKGFETGANSNLEVLDSKRDFFFVQRDYLKARYDYLLNLLNLKRQVGSLSPNDLSMINGLLELATINSANALEEITAITLPEIVTETQDLVVEEAGLQQAAIVDASREAEVLDSQSVQNDGSMILRDSGERRQMVGHLWLFEQDPEQYSVQVASVDSEQSAIDFITTKELGDAHYFYSPRGGEPMYFILQGVYENQRSASKSLSELGFTDVWVRKVRNLQTGRCAVAAKQTSFVAAEVNKLCDKTDTENNIALAQVDA